MKSTFIIALLFLITTSITAQVNYQNEQSGTYQTGSIDSPFLRVSKSSGNKIVGSIYLNEDWEQAIITVSTNNTIKSMARFNAYHSEIEILVDEKVNALLAVEGLEVLLNHRVFVSLRLTNTVKPIFAERLVDGMHSLYRVYDIKINKAPSDAKLLNLESDDRVDIYSELYLKNNDDKIQKVPTNKKELKNILSKEMIELASQQKLSLKKEDDLIELFKLANSTK